MTMQQFSDSTQESWRSMIAKYQKSDLRKSIWQIVDTFVPYFVLLTAMYYSMGYSYWITLALAIPAAGFQVRIFIIFHDCTHGSYFKLQRTNDIVGIICGLLTMTPYYEWRHNHSIHHATGSDLDHRGTGDIWMLTVKEYLALSKWERLKYRVFRNPIVMLLIGPPVMFIVAHRFSSENSGLREKRSVHWTSAGIVAITISMSLLIGFVPFIMMMLPVLWISGMIGIWLFYVQHQFDATYWEHHKEWDFFESALKGSSFYKLPKVLQFFSGNIGFHHIHHLSPRIPNYKLQKTQKEVPIFQSVKSVTLFQSFRFLVLRLWDEEERKLVGFRAVKRLLRNHKVL
ncbi:MAG: fatty acid desaturase [Bacteroidetes bacterium]|nr:fatty acid desaturase [Bacteroidota bacterium]